MHPSTEKMIHHLRDSSPSISYATFFKRLITTFIIFCCIAIYPSPYYRNRAINVIHNTDDILSKKTFGINISMNRWNTSKKNLNKSIANDRWPLLNTEAIHFGSILNKFGLNNLTTIEEDFGNISLDDIEIVTAWSMNHYEEAIRLCDNIQKFDELQKKKRLRLISYNLGDVSPAVLENYSHICPIVEIRAFNFSEFPSYVSNLSEYRWKPLIIADVLRTSKALLWVDSSTLFIKDTFSLQDILDREAKDRQGIWLFDATGHSIAAATNPLMFKYLPMNNEQAMDIQMWGADVMLWIGRSDIRTNLMKPLVECALIKECMAPVGSRLSCKFSGLEKRVYANCHRFDQSAINVIVSSRAAFNVTKYTLYHTVLKTSRLG